MSNQHRSGDRPSTEEFAFRGMTSYRQPTEADIQRGIDAAMRDEIRSRYNPTVQPALPTVRVEGAPRVVDADSMRRSGWAEPKPTGLPPGQDLIEGMVNAALPHGSTSKVK